jgi:hypothetical protein
MLPRRHRPAHIRNSHAKPPVQKEAVMAEDIIAMVETLDRGSLRGLRDRAMLLIGFAGGLRRSEIVGLDLKADQTEDGRGSIEILEKGMLITLRGTIGWRKVEVGRGSADANLPARRNRDLDQVRQAGSWRASSPRGRARASCRSGRLNDKEVVRLVEREAAESRLKFAQSMLAAYAADALPLRATQEDITLWETEVQRQKAKSDASITDFCS